MAAVVTWKTMDGTVIPVKDMEIDHMHRCVHMVARMRKVGMAIVADAVGALRYAAPARWPRDQPTTQKV